MSVSNRLRIDSQFTMDDLAAELGLSKSTVSRALSGSGRIGAETRERVKACAEKHGFRPNLVAKALAGQKTMNIAAVLPLESASSQMMFYHECLSGMVVRASEDAYSILVTMAQADDTSALEELIRNRKADAVVLTQLKHDDKNVALLREADMPFVVIGSGAGDDVAQVDSKMQESCAAFALKCASGLHDGDKVLFVCGSLDVEANNKRLSGFLSAMESAGIESLRYAVCTELADLQQDANLKQWRLMLCSDDVVCLALLEMLRREGIAVGSDVLVASFHDSVLLEQSVPAVSALRVDARTLGSTAAVTALKMLSGAEFAQASFVDCSFQLRASTGSVDSSVTANDNDSRRLA